MGSSRRPHPHSADARGRLQPFVAGIAKDIGPMLAKYMEGDSLQVMKIREEVEKLMDERLKVLSPVPPSPRCPVTVAEPSCAQRRWSGGGQFDERGVRCFNFRSSRLNVLRS